MKARGMQGAALEVDAENTSNALHLYESCGYRIEHRWDMYRKELLEERENVGRKNN
jgi:ribosomal protein S18 acetylase RimI-like enzyme